LLSEHALVDIVEVVAESCFAQRRARREARALAELWPIVLHGVKMSLGSADGIDVERARRLGALAREVRAQLVTEHVAFTQAGGVEIGHLTQLPRTREAVAVVARNVARVRRELPDVSLALENVAWSYLWPHDEMDEPTFYHEIVRATGCELLLDVGNLYANAINEGLDPRDVIARYPLDRVAMVHVAGGVREHGFYYDTHAHAIAPAVFELVAIARAVRPDAPVVLERDASFDVAEIVDELRELRAIAPAHIARPHAPSSPLAAPATATLASAQAALAIALVHGAPHDPAVGDTERARDILHRKRIDDALPLLHELSRDGERVRELAVSALATHARPPRRAGPTDAWRIADAALAVPELADAAAIDRLVLRARFADRDGALAPRRGPFIGYARLRDGSRVRATKGLGQQAEVKLATGR
jgi:uncharacterized protein (UPF0276 family)